jgi:predicted negative regulator of RcsB-dependent stress response
MYEHLGDIYAKQGRRDQATGVWQKALTLTRNESDASRLKAKLSGVPAKEK